MAVLSATFDELSARLNGFGQEHLLAHWRQLSDDERARLAGQIERIDFQSLAEQFRIATGGHVVADSPAAKAARAKSPPSVLAGSRKEEAIARGEAALRAGEVGMILVAGGQGTRLGFEHPKGLFPIGPVSKRTLFEVIVDRLRAVSKRFGVKIPLYVMTSPATTAETEAFFLEKRHFGLVREDELRIFEQGTMPAVDAKTGRVLLDSPSELALAPDGHGGMLAALARVIGFEELKRRGIRTLFYGQIDNPLLTVCDPEFLGHHLLANSELTTQVVRKHDPAEKVGVVAQVDEHLEILEYSDLTPEQTAKREPDGTLSLWAGNTAVHAFDVAFLERVSGSASGLPFHLAKKKVPYINEAGERIEPVQPNAIKFERFIFDLLPLASNALVVEVDRATCFAPVKNADGAASDTPTAARIAMVAQHRAWLEAAGVEVAPEVSVEIHPSFALDADELKTKVAPATRVAEDAYFV
jgi:UDP-N-acetylglucosamine/UDP-N-acetylgalactosamine diphosphorylase